MDPDMQWGLLISALIIAATTFKEFIYHQSAGANFLASMAAAFLASLTIVLLIISGFHVTNGFHMWIFRVLMFISLLSMGLGMIFIAPTLTGGN